jgi:hypothetical protein
MAVPQIELKVTGAERTKKTFLELARRIDDMTPVWEDFADYYKDDLMKVSWQSKGALMEGSRWSPLTAQYRKWKAKSGGSKELMKLTGKLFNAATGGAGWKQKISKDNLIMGVEGEAYYYWVQHRQKNGRFYFYTKDEDLPKRAWAKLVKLADDYLEDADDR